MGISALMRVVIPICLNDDFALGAPNRSELYILLVINLVLLSKERSHFNSSCTSIINCNVIEDPSLCCICSSGGWLDV